MTLSGDCTLGCSCCCSAGGAHAAALPAGHWRTSAPGGAARGWKGRAQRRAVPPARSPIPRRTNKRGRERVLVAILVAGPDQVITGKPPPPTPCLVPKLECPHLLLQLDGLFGFLALVLLYYFAVLRPGQKLLEGGLLRRWGLRVDGVRQHDQAGAGGDIPPALLRPCHPSLHPCHRRT